MWWLEVKSEKELKSLAKEKYKSRQFENTKKEINKDIDFFIDKIDLNIGAKNTKKLVASGWKELNSKINKIKNVYKNFEKIEVKEEVSKKEKEKIVVENEIEYFKSEADELIFYILELSGKKRNEKLKIEESFYKNKKEGKKWRNSILKKIHPDICKNRKTNEAINEFEQLCRLVLDE
ncbi:MAG: hypothetical protein ACRDDY_04520 [Clostridium sp.]|uniref:hypothetical protein n=1 Tax=Clostridium sp. TaxID=1506 RepID=UPI003EE75A25